MEQLRQDVTESTLGESIGIMVDGLSISDQDYVTGGGIVVKYHAPKRQFQLTSRARTSAGNIQPDRR